MQPIPGKGACGQVALVRTGNCGGGRVGADHMGARIGQKAPAVAELLWRRGMDPEKSVRDLAAPGQEQ